MTFYYNDSWLGYIAENIVRKAMSICQEECPGCRDKKQSAILDLHYQLSLLEKLKLYFERIRGEMLSNIAIYYSNFEQKLPHSDDRVKDKNVYIQIARSFLLTSSADTVYFGRYLSETLDDYIAEAFIENKSKNVKRKKST